MKTICRRTFTLLALLLAFTVTGFTTDNVSDTFIDVGTLLPYLKLEVNTAENELMLTVSYGGLRSDADRYLVTALYDKTGRVVDSYALTEAGTEGTVIVTYPDNGSAVLAKAFLLDCEASLKPLCKAASAQVPRARIIKDSEILKLENGNYAIQYSLLNPYTGGAEWRFGMQESKEVAVLESLPIGCVAEISDGMRIDESTAGEERIYLSADTYWIKSYDADLQTMVVAPYNDMNDEYVLRVPDSVVFTKFGGLGWNKDDSNMVRWGTWSVVSAADLESANKTLKGINDRVFDEASGSFTTVYAKYPKAYLRLTWYDSADGNSGFDGMLDFLTVIVNMGETIENCLVDA